MKVKRVLKYKTGQEIPEGAVYLYTRVDKYKASDDHVWHYFLVEDKK